MTSIFNLFGVLTFVCFIFHFNIDYNYDCGLCGNLKKDTVIQHMSKMKQG